MRSRSAVVRAIAAPLLGALLVGCTDGCRGERGERLTGGATAVDSEVSGLPAMSAGTLRGLGSHVWEASLDRRGDRAGLWPSREVVSRMVWAELDQWEFTETSGGSVRHEIQLDGDLYRRQSNGGRYRYSEAPPGNAIVLKQQLDLWDQALAPFADRAAWREDGADELDGRPVRVLRLELAPPIAPDTAFPVDPQTAMNRMGVATDPIAVRGHVYVDVKTGNRLLAELEGQFVARALVGGRDATDEVHVSYRERRSLTSLPPTILAPAPEQVLRVTRRMPGAPAKPK